MDTNALLNAFLQRRSAWRQRESEVAEAFEALRRQIDICTVIMRRDGIAATDFDHETITKLQALGTRFAALHGDLERDFPPPLPGALPDAA